MKRRLEEFVCAILLFAAAMLLVWPSLGGGMLPLDLSHARSLEPWRAAGPASIPVSAFAERHLYETYPAYRHMAGVLESGSGLRWNPTDGIGVPFLGQGHTRALSPFSLPVYVLGLERGLALSALLKMLVAAFAAFYTARRFGFHHPVAALVAILFMCSSPLLVWSSEPLSDALPWAPLLLLAGERIALGQRLAWPGAAIGLGLMGLAGHPPAVVGGVLFLAAYVVLRTPGLPLAARGMRLAPVGVACALGLVAGAVQWAPFLEYLGQTSDNGNGLHAAASPSWLGLLTPTAAGPLGQSTALLFPGLIALLIVPLWFVLRRYMEAPVRNRTTALLLIAIAGAVLSLGLGPLLQGGFLAPWVDSSTFLLPLALALAFVVGATAEEWIILNADQITASVARISVWVPIAWGALLVVVIAGCVFGAAGFWPLLPFFVAALMAFVLFAVTLFRPNLRLLGWGLGAAALITSGWALNPLRPATPANAPLPDTQFSQALLAGDFDRIAGSGALASWPLSLLDMQQCFSPNSAGLSRVATFQAAANETPLLLRRTGAEGLLLTKQDIQGAMSDLRPVLHSKAVFEQGAILFEDASMTTRARVIYSGRRLGQAAQPGDIVDGPPALEGATLPEDGESAPGAATINTDTPEEVRVSVPNGPPGILVLSDLWYPGWRAFVDGDPMPVLPVDAAFRGVEIGEGAHEVVFQYRPGSLRLGMALTAFAALIILLGFYRSFAVE